MRRARLPDWADRLVVAIETQRRAPFAWGAADCATLYGAAIEALTGEDPLATYRPWRDETSALRAVLSAGCRSAADFVAMTMVSIHPSRAARGDVGYCAGLRPRLAFPAIIMGAEAVSRDESGWIIIPRGLISEAWSTCDAPVAGGQLKARA